MVGINSKREKEKLLIDEHLYIFDKKTQIIPKFLKFGDVKKSMQRPDPHRYAEKFCAPDMIKFIYSSKF